ARADDAAGGAVLPAYAPFKLVGVMFESGQALLFDDIDREYRLAKAGDNLDGWRLSSVEGDRVIVSQGERREELALVSPAPPIARAAAGAAVAEHLPPMVIGSNPAPEAPPVSGEKPPTIG